MAASEPKEVRAKDETTSHSLSHPRTLRLSSITVESVPISSEFELRRSEFGFSEGCARARKRTDFDRFGANRVFAVSFAFNVARKIGITVSLL